MFSKPHRFSIFFILLLLLIAAGCTPAASASTHEELLAQIPSLYTDGAKQAPGTYAGPVENSNFFVGLVTQGNLAVAYLCNGTDVGDWMKGTTTNGQLELTSLNGAKLSGTLSGSTVTGTVTSPKGEARPFTATAAVEGETGFYRHTETVNGAQVVAGWVLIENGVRGTSTDGGSISIITQISDADLKGTGNSGSGDNTVSKDDPSNFIFPVTPLPPGKEVVNTDDVITIGGPPEVCEKEGCDASSEPNSGPSCESLKNSLEQAKKETSKVEKQLATKGVKDVNGNPVAKKADKAVKNILDQINANNCK